MVISNDQKKKTLDLLIPSTGHSRKNSWRVKDQGIEINYLSDYIHVLKKGSINNLIF